MKELIFEIIPFVKPIGPKITPDRNRSIGKKDWSRRHWGNKKRLKNGNNNLLGTSFKKPEKTL